MSQRNPPNTCLSSLIPTEPVKITSCENMTQNQQQSTRKLPAIHRELCQIEILD